MAGAEPADSKSASDSLLFPEVDMANILKILDSKDRCISFLGSGGFSPEYPGRNPGYPRDEMLFRVGHNVPDLRQTKCSRATQNF